MDNVWFNPEGYQRTSKRLQRQCMTTLMSFDAAGGHVLDVGCGTGNALDVLPQDSIERYLGIDVSPEMVSYARRKHGAEHIRFEVGDFLAYALSDSDKFDTVICAACLHWFIPNEQLVIDKMAHAMRPDAKLFLSCAYHFDFLLGENIAQKEALDYIRQKYQTIAPAVVFDDFRFDADTVNRRFSDFDLIKVNHIEERVNFDSFDNFRDWHLGSGSVLYHQFAPADREQAVQSYYRILYDQYVKGAHEVSYATALMLFQKKVA